MKLIIDYWSRHTEVEIGYLRYELDDNEKPIDIQASVNKEELETLDNDQYLGNYRELDEWEKPRYGNKDYMVLMARLPQFRVEGATVIEYKEGL